MNPQLAQIRETLLMGPGPSCVPPSVYEAMACPTLGHLDPRFLAIMDEIKERLRTLLATSQAVTLPMSGTGSAGMETCFVNLTEPGDRVLVLQNGVFGKRMAEVAGRLGAEVEVLEFPWGTPVRVEAVREQLARARYDLCAVVHAETSTGVANPVAEIGALLRDHPTLYVVDAVTSLGGMPVLTETWGIDALYSGTQKCLSCPPGLAPVSFSARALERLRRRRAKVPNWYLDLSLILGYWEGSQRTYHHTAPINQLYGLAEALTLIDAEGLEPVYARHREAHARLVEGLSAIGLEMLVEAPWRLPMLNAVKIPPGVDDRAVRTALLRDHGIEIGAGLGPLAGQIWRVGLMGHTARPENVRTFLAALRAVL